MPLPFGLGEGAGKGEESPRVQKPVPVPVPVRCSVCKTAGLVEFHGGFDFKRADALANEHAIKIAKCFGCGRENVEAVPIPALTETDKKEFRHLWEIANTLKALRDGGLQVPRGNFIEPLARIKARGEAILKERARERTEDP